MSATADWILPVGERTAEEIAGDIAGLVRAIGGALAQMLGAPACSHVQGVDHHRWPGRSAVLSNDWRAKAAGKGSRLFVVTDENVHRAWGKAVGGLLEASQTLRGTLVVASGEESKTVQSLERCWEWLASLGARRDDIVVALGGGVVGDLAGFAAATYQRGLSLWQIPTSLLAQVDSSVGGKTAVNLAAGKNLGGRFLSAGPGGGRSGHAGDASRRGVRERAWERS